MRVGRDRRAPWSAPGDGGYGPAAAAGETRVRRTTAASIARRALAETRAALTVRGSSRFLRSLVEGGAPYLDLLCTDRDGRVVAASDPHQLGQMLGERDWARTALRGEEFLSGPIPATDHTPAALEIAVPIRLDEQTGTIGALLGRYDWNH